MSVDDDMCPNCVTPWKCNGPHLEPATETDKATDTAAPGNALSDSVPPATDEQIEVLAGYCQRKSVIVPAEVLPLLARLRAEREGRLRAETQVRALKEALGEALEAAREPRAERALAALREIREYCDSLYRLRHADAEYRPDDGVLAVASSALWSIRRHGFGGGS